MDCDLAALLPLFGLDQVELLDLISHDWQQRYDSDQATSNDHDAVELEVSLEDDLVDLVVEDEALDRELAGSHQAEQDRVDLLVPLQHVRLTYVNGASDEDHLVNHEGDG